MLVILFRWRGDPHRAEKSVNIEASVGERGHEGAAGIELDALSKRDSGDHLARVPIKTGQRIKAVFGSVEIDGVIGGRDRGQLPRQSFVVVDPGTLEAVRFCVPLELLGSPRARNRGPHAHDGG